MIMDYSPWSSKNLIDLFIFIMHCLRLPEVRKVWAGWFKMATGKEIGEFTSTAGPRQKKNTDSLYSDKMGKFSRI